MASTGTVSEKGGSDPSSAIYGSARSQSSKRVKLERLLIGAVTGAATWMMIDLLGAPHIFGIGSDAGLIPFAVLGAVLGVTRFRALFLSLSFVLLCVVIVVGYTDVTSHAMDKFVRRDPVPATADAVVVLSGGVTPDGYLSQQGLDRTLRGVTLVEDGIAPVLLFTREERKARGVKSTNAGDQLLFARLAGIARVMTTRPVKSTRDEAVAVADIAKYRGWKRIVLVTSPFRSRRACATFERVGLTVSCIPSDSRDVAIRRLVYPHDRLLAFGLWLYETAGTLRYRQMGWIGTKP
jgi:uncharacterized SAM-binding protein YcdF (DUF218 family)